jgi:hypothetical protein
MRDLWEGIADAHLAKAKIGTPVDPWLIAWSLHIEVRSARPGTRAVLDGDVIRVDPTARFERQCFDIAHECAHAIATDHGVEDTEAACNGIAAALLLPRVDFIRDVRQTNGCLLGIRARQPYASCEVIVRRKLSIDPGVAWVWDVAPKRKRYPIVTHGFRWPHRRPTPAELEVMHAALEAKAPVESRCGIRAWPIVDHDAVRVISAAPFEVLEAFV